MSITYIGGSSSTGSSASADIAHGLTIADGDLITVYINRNDSVAIATLAGFTEALQETPPTGETASQAVFWKIAGASEPSTYSFDLTSSSNYRVIIKQFRPTSGALVKLAGAGGYSAPSVSDAVCAASNSRDVETGDLSIVFSGKDRGYSGETYNAVDGGFTDIVGAGDTMIAVSAHKLHTSNETLSDITFSSVQQGSADSTYSVHIAFAEGAAATLTTTTFDVPEWPNLLPGTHTAELTDSNGAVTLANVPVELPTGWSIVQSDGTTGTALADHALDTYGITLTSSDYIATDGYTVDVAGNVLTGTDGPVRFWDASAATWHWTTESSYSYVPVLSVDSTSAGMQRGTSFYVTFSNAATPASIGNTSLTSGDDTLTCTSVVSSGPSAYTATFDVGDLSKQVDGTGYVWTLTVDAETDNTSAIPLTIQADYTLVDLVDPVSSQGSMLEGYTGTAAVSGDHLEYDITSTLDSGVTVSVLATGEVNVSQAVDGDWVSNITVDRRVVQTDGTIGTTETMTIEVDLTATSDSLDLGWEISSVTTSNALDLVWEVYAGEPTLTDTLLDAENSNAVIINETDLTIHVYDTDGGTELYSTVAATTDGSGVFSISDDLVGGIGDTVFVVFKRSNGQTACGTMTVVDGA